MAIIQLTLTVEEYLVTGKQITFEAPCDSNNVTGISIQGTYYDLVDFIGNKLPDNAFFKGSMVSVILNNETSKAFIQNPNTNEYLNARLVEIEQAREDVHGNRYTSLSERLNADYTDIEGKTNTPRERRKLSSELSSVSSDYLYDSGKEYQYYDGKVKNISFTNLTEENGEISEDYWCLIIFNKAPETSNVGDIITNGGIKLLNPDLDLSDYTVVHLLLTYDGFNVCCIVAGY